MGGGEFPVGRPVPPDEGESSHVTLSLAVKPGPPDGRGGVPLT